MNRSIAVNGASGRMGKILIQRILDDPFWKLVSAWDVESSGGFGLDAAEIIGRESCGVPITAGFSTDADLIIDFSSSLGTQRLVRHMIDNSMTCALVSGTTGLSDVCVKDLDTLAETAPVLYAPNFSLGVNLLGHLVRLAAKSLSQEYDIEIFEAHHNKKEDAPSGTALWLGQSAAKGRDVLLEDAKDIIRNGRTGPRIPGQIGFSVVRGGGIVGDHTVSFVSDEEMITLGHRALSRDLFVDGALKAAGWLSGQPTGSYRILDMLNLHD